MLEIPVNTYFPESAAAKEYVGETANQTYIDKPLKEMTDLMIKEREFVNETEFTKLLKSVPEMSQEKRKFVIRIMKTFLK